MLFFPGRLAAQFNLNRYNGLPTNHVYMFLKDRNGYLWIATDQGVLRYNGYELRLFNSAQGLGNSDTWQIYQDRKGRIWLFGYSNSFGYIYKDAYHKAVESDKLIIPWSDVYESEQELFIMGEKPGPSIQHIRHYILFHDQDDALPKKPLAFKKVMRNADTVVACDFLDGHLAKQKRCIFPAGTFPRFSYDSRIALYHDRIFLYVRKRIPPMLINTDDCTSSKPRQYTFGKNFSMLNSGIPSCRKNSPEYLHVFYREKIEKLDTTMHVIGSFPVRELTRKGLDGHDIVYLFEDSMWGKCVATESNGAFITPGPSSPFKKYTAWNATGFSFISSLNDSTGYWWNVNKHMLATISPGAAPVLRKYEQLPVIERIIPYTGARAFVVADEDHLLDGQTGRLSPTLHHTPDTILPGTDKHYVITSSTLMIKTFRQHSSTSQSVLQGKFNGVASCPNNRSAWVYNEYTLYLIDRHDAAISQHHVLKRLGISSLEKLLVDRYGAMLFKTPDRLILYHPVTRTRSVLLPNCNLANVKISLSDEWLIAAGEFGIAFCRIMGPGRYAQPVIYPNIKDEFYVFVNDIQVMKNSVLMYTDQGMYTVAVPRNDTALYHPELRGTFLLQYDDSTYVLPRTQHISISQENGMLQFDVIRPTGNGQLKYAYRLEGADTLWHELNANELLLPQLAADQVYRLTVKVKDAVWQSDEISVALYIKPHWWQVAPGLQLIWMLVILAVVVISLLASLTTRRIIMKNAAKRNQLLELELKAVYAQINPHFIFNTLNSALHFIRKQKLDDAHNHILRFSQLLRAYLKASRHRFITLSEEIVNLRNYIELQQTRFSHIFDYSISLDNIDDPGKISIPSLLLQPIVENAIQHGLLPKEAHGELDIHFSLDSQHKQLTCTIRDNGIGRSRSKAMQEADSMKRESYGDDLVRGLISLFNKYEHMGIELTYHDLPAPETGTLVTIIIQNPHLPHE